MNEKIVITSAACTPMGGFQSVLAPVSAPELGAAAIGAAVERDGFSPMRSTRSLWVAYYLRAWVRHRLGRRVWARDYRAL